MGAKKFPGPDGLTLAEWGELREGLVDLSIALDPSYSEGGLLGAFVTSEGRAEEAKKRFMVIRDLSSLAWVQNNGAIAASQKAFSKLHDPSLRDEVQFLAMLVFYLEGFYLRQDTSTPRYSPSSETRRSAASAARTLADFIDRKHVASSNPEANRTLLDALTGYAVEQEQLAAKRKPRTDATSDARQFILGLARSIVRNFGTCMPAMVKPLGVLISYETDDRNWQRLIARAREEVSSVSPPG